MDGQIYLLKRKNAMSERKHAVTCLPALAITPATSSIQGDNLPPLNDRHESTQGCIEKYINFPEASGVLYCHPIFDSYLCWPPTPAGAVAIQNCPPARLSDTTQKAFRRCGENGMWLGRKPNESSIIGWTNYTPCFPAEVQSLFVKVYEDEQVAQMKFWIAEWTRILEIIGFSLSMVALLISLGIFHSYRSLHNNRTRIHKSLFIAMIVQVFIRLTVYIDQAVARRTNSYMNATIHAIETVPYLCEGTYVMLEYAITVMFMWMFIEGLYLHNLVTANALRDRTSYKLYFIMGWGLPAIVTGVWATLSAIHYRADNVKRCWYGYNFSNLYWLMQAPRLAVVIVNMLFLLNIMRVLIVKLRRSENSEVERVRKAVRAALVLLPLLGITNLLNMIEAPLDGSVWVFALWSFTTHFLRSFQGFFIALIYCFLNGEVRQVITKDFEDRKIMRQQGRKNRDSFLKFMSSSGENRTRTQRKQERVNKSTWIPLKFLNWTRETSITNNHPSDTEMGADSSQERRPYATADHAEDNAMNFDPCDLPPPVMSDDIEIGDRIESVDTA